MQHERIVTWENAYLAKKREYISSCSPNGGFFIKDENKDRAFFITGESSPNDDSFTLKVEEPDKLSEFFAHPRKFKFYKRFNDTTLIPYTILDMTTQVVSSVSSSTFRNGNIRYITVIKIRKDGFYSWLHWIRDHVGVVSLFVTTVLGLLSIAIQLSGKTINVTLVDHVVHDELATKQYPTRYHPGKL
jgi:hypothetical protein